MKVYVVLDEVMFVTDEGQSVWPAKTQKIFADEEEARKYATENNLIVREMEVE